MATEMPMEEQQREVNVDHEANNTIILPEKLLQDARSDPKRHMQKVPPLLRQANNQQDYDPLVVSLGPYHHGKKELQLVEDFKLKTLHMFVADSGKDVSFFYNKVHEKINEARSCYFKESTEAYDNQTFAQMMLLDACVIINYILILIREQSLSTTNRHLGNLVSSMLDRDLLLLENQIPYFILKLLIGLRYGEEKGEEKLRIYLNTAVFGSDKHHSLPKNDRGEHPLHLLEALWLFVVSKSDELQPTSSCPNNCLIAYNDALGFLLRHIGNLSTRFIWRRQSHDNKGLSEKYIHSFRSVSDLKARGIHFRPSDDSSLHGFKFKSGYFYAQLDVPVDYPNDNAKVFYSNLAAFEMCAQTAYLPVCDYLEFMKSLLDNPMDAKELREKKILFSSLDSDEEVVRFYKDIKVPGEYLSDAFQDVKDEIEAHYNNKAKTWLAELIHTNFQSPWKALALFGGIVLLVLTLLQTFFTIKPCSTK